MSDRDNITLPREVAKLALSYIEWHIENERGGSKDRHGFLADEKEAADALIRELDKPTEGGT